MKKKFMLAICGLFMMAAVVPSGRIDANAAVVKGTCGENITWEYDAQTQELVLSGNGAMEDCDYDKVPWNDCRDEIKRVIVGEGITSIGNYAFNECVSIESITLPSGITRIGEHAFAYTSITGMELPESVLRIEDGAFWACEELIDMELPEGIEFLGRQAFGSCENWENGDIPSGVKELGNAVFQGCSKLESVVIPDGITSVPSNMFFGCHALRTAKIPNSVTEIDDAAFDMCYSLQNIELPEGLVYIGRDAFFDCKRLTEITIPKGITEIKPNAFCGCVALKQVNFNEEIEIIWLDAFEDCKALTNIVLPKSLREMPAGTFRNCIRLSSVYIPESLETIYSGNFENAKNLFRMTIDSRAVLKAIGDPEYDEGILDYPKTVYIWSNIKDELDLTQFGYTKAGETDKNGKHYIIYSDHPHKESGCATCMTTGIEFTDIKVSDYYYSPVIWAADEGVTAGLTPTSFGPNMGCTRAQVVTFLWRAMDCPEVTPQQNFADVPEGAYYYDAVHWAANNGITYGYGDGKFGSEDMVTRAQFVSFLWRLKGEKKATCANPFKDLYKDAYYYDAVLWAVEKGITSGLYPDQFAPNATCTRGQVVSFIFRTGQWEVDQLKIVFPG